MNIEKPSRCDVELPEGWKYEEISNGVYQIMKTTGGKVDQYPEWLKSTGFEDVPRVYFKQLTLQQARFVEQVNNKANFGSVVLWIIEMCEGPWRPITDTAFYIENESDRAMFKLTWS